MSNINSHSPLRQAGFHDLAQSGPKETKPEGSSSAVTIARGHAPANSNIQGGVSIANAASERSGAVLVAASKSRLSHLASTLGAPFRAVAAALDNKLFEPARAEKREFARIAEARANLREALGAPSTGSILNQTITTAQGQSTVEDLMTSYVASIKKSSTATTAEAMTFVRMGERIVEELYKGKGEDFRLPLTTTTPDGSQITIPSNLDTTRAISWYLQAKGMVQNADAGRENVTLNSGSMTVGDPGNRLYKYLSSAPNCYGRCSSHHERRSAADGDRPATATKGFTAPFLHGLGKQPMQTGIEDFTNKFPSNGGTLLFDKLKEGVRGGELFLKWEQVGMPDAIGGGRVAKHGDTREEKAGFLMAAGRCKGHLFNFLNRHAPKEGLPRGEQAAKLFGKESTLIKDFQEMVKSSNLGSADKKAYALNKDHQDVQNIYEGLGKLMQLAADEGKPIEPFQDMIRTIADLDAQIGTEMGILRSGAEMHVRLP